MKVKAVARAIWPGGRRTLPGRARSSCRRWLCLGVTRCRPRSPGKSRGAAHAWPGTPHPPALRSTGMTRTKRTLATLATTGTLALAPAVPAMAQGPVVTGGLVNVTVTDVANNVLSNDNIGVGAALKVAANVCGVGVNVLATQLGTSGPVSCTNTLNGQRVDITQVQ